MKTYKVTRGPHYDAGATMAVPEPRYLLGTAFISYFLGKVSWVIANHF